VCKSPLGHVWASYVPGCFGRNSGEQLRHPIQRCPVLGQVVPAGQLAWIMVADQSLGHAVLPDKHAQWQVDANPGIAERRSIAATRRATVNC
jgi:hypothetical protein